MKKLLGVVISLLFVTGRLWASGDTFGGIKLLEGYHAVEGRAVDASSWRIEKTGGLSIHFEAGFSEGCVVRPKDKDKYAWYREQTINGQKVLLALIKPGLKTDPDLDEERNLPPGNILLVSFPLPGSAYHTANFAGRIANSEEMVDMLLMVLTFDPSKGSF